ncbi:CASP8 and FADD-like apoptosis regulator isoform X2 [Narcine bancroftii]|uniref:CASP8 and FADD-like apoptosis regulator isoform X2 n=1 Tax=Narcine bancroftii TaxID=1343680 RepID=UPI0038319078
MLKLSAGQATSVEREKTNWHFLSASLRKKEVENLMKSFENNNLRLIVDKTMEMIVDFRRTRGDHRPLHIYSSVVERVESTKFLRVHLQSNLSCTYNISSLVGKEQQRLHFLRRMRQARLPTVHHPVNFLQPCWLHHRVEMSSVQPVFTPQLLRQHVHSNWPSFATASSEENGVKALSMSLSMSKQPKPAGASWPAQQLQNEVETYKMQSNPIGLCLIIDCIGTDADLLKETFEALKFCVLLHLYIKLDEMEKILKEVSERDDLATIDCFVCCIISRGTPDSMLAVDGSNHGLSFDQIQCYFKGQPCHPLLGKPRLFFIQDFLWTPVDGELEVPEVPIQVDGNNWKEIVPQEADILWSCCQVAQSLLHLAPQQPSSFMRTLSESLRKHQHKSDLVSILTEVNRKTMLRNHQLSRLQSKPLILRHTLRKKLVFP